LQRAERRLGALPNAEPEEPAMTQTLTLPMWVRFEPVLRFDAEGLLALSVPYRSEGFAEDLEDDIAPVASTTESRR
jgi:hypothetical protein